MEEIKQDAAVRGGNHKFFGEGQINGTALFQTAPHWEEENLLPRLHPLAAKCRSTAHTTFRYVDIPVLGCLSRQLYYTCLCVWPMQK